MMNTPHWELSVLCRAVEYLNLSAASSHVGVSQPQLSRIVAKIEAQLGVVLLDRTAKRQSTWTPEARGLVEIYLRSSRGLQAEVENLVGRSRPTRLAVGCLEGLVEHAAAVCHAVLVRQKLQTIELDVHDIDSLETNFLNGTLDAIYTCREIVRRKPRFARVVAGQLVELTGSNDKVVVRSHYEHRSIPQRQRHGRQEVDTLIVSNSLAVRAHWIKHYGGMGVIPSKPKRRDGRNSKEAPVYLFGSDKLQPELWRLLETLSAKL